MEDTTTTNVNIKTHSFETTTIITLLVHWTSHGCHGSITNTIIGSRGGSRKPDIGHLTRHLASQGIDQGGVLVGVGHGAHLVHGHPRPWLSDGSHVALGHHSRPWLLRLRAHAAASIAAHTQTIQRPIGQAIGGTATIPSP